MAPVDAVQSFLDRLIILLAAAWPHVLPVLHQLNRHRRQIQMDEQPLHQAADILLLSPLWTVLCREANINSTIIHIHHAV